MSYNAYVCVIWPTGLYDQICLVFGTQNEITLKTIIVYVRLIVKIRSEFRKRFFRSTRYLVSASVVVHVSCFVSIPYILLEIN